MKVSDFKGVQICSRYDGQGIIEQISVDRNVHFIIKFQNNQLKTFFAPLAFNSGILSTRDKKLKEYIQLLNQDDNFKRVIRPNDDIPTANNLKITISDKYALTRHNLALLGGIR